MFLNNIKIIMIKRINIIISIKNRIFNSKCKPCKLLLKFEN